MFLRKRPARSATGNATALQFQISETERPLITAAVQLGEWLLAQREINRKQKKIVTQMLDALRRMPEVTDSVAAEFGFQLRTMNEGTLLYRAWRVSLSQAGLEIYSVYSPDKKIELADKMMHELNYWVKPGEGSGHDGRYIEEWIAEVREPERLKPGALEFALYAAYFH
jgi:hypothetical protein